MKLSKMPKPEAFYICRTIDGELHTFDKRCTIFRVEEGMVFFSCNDEGLSEEFAMAAIPKEQITIIERKEKGEQLHG